MRPIVTEDRAEGIGARSDLCAQPIRQVVAHGPGESVQATEQREQGFSFGSRERRHRLLLLGEYGSLARSEAA